MIHRLKKYWPCILLILIFLETDDYWDQNINRDCYMQLKLKCKFIDAKTNNSQSLIVKYIPARVKAQKQQIPYYIFNTYENDYVPWKLKYSINSLIEKNPEYAYRYFNATERRQFLERYFGKVTIDSYEKLKANAYRADLFRYSLIYLYGGCYVDIPYVFIDRMSSVLAQNTKFFSTVDDQRNKLVVNSAFFCASPGHEIIRLVLQKAITAIANQDYGIDTLDITGPRRFAEAYKQYVNMQQVVSGIINHNEIILLDRLFQDNCLQNQYPKPNGQIFALNRYPDFNSDRQKQPSKHYSQFYNSKQVFNKQIKINLPSNYSFQKPQNINFNVNDFLIPDEFKNKETV